MTNEFTNSARFDGRTIRVDKASDNGPRGGYGGRGGGYGGRGGYPMQMPYGHAGGYGMPPPNMYGPVAYGRGYPPQAGGYGPPPPQGMQGMLL